MFEGSDLLDSTDAALLARIRDRELCAKYENEITEAEYIQGLLDEHRQAPYRAFDVDLDDTDLSALADAEAITRLVQVEAGIAQAHALRARLVALLAANRPASADRPGDQPGATAERNRDAHRSDVLSDPASEGGTGAGTVAEAVPDRVPEVLGVSEWLAHELQMAHPYSWTAAQALVETSLVLTGRLSATLRLLGAGRIDYRRAQILTDLLGTCSESVAHTVEAMVLPKAPALTPGGLASAVRRALAQVDAAALRRRHAAARRAAEVRYWPTAEGMARLVADLPLPAAAACCDAIGRYAATQRAAGDDRPVGQIRTEVLTDLILRPWDTSRPAVTAEITVHLTIPTTSSTATSASAGVAAGLDGAAAQAEVDGQTVTAAQCRELLAQLDASRMFLALHDVKGPLVAVATPAQLRRAARRRRRRGRTGTDGTDGTDGADGCDGPGLRPPPRTPGYRPSRAQDRHVRTRDRTCRHFGCTRKAIHADLDHYQPWPAGPTAVCNLCCYCRTHHRLKHQAPGWTRAFDPDGTLTIATPTGTTRTTRPPGVEWPIEATDLLPAAAPPGIDAARPTPQPNPDPPGADPPF